MTSIEARIAAVDTYTLITDGRVVGTVTGPFREAMDAAREQSKIDKGVRSRRNGVWHTGSIVTIWSGPISPRFEGHSALGGVVSHAKFSCGHPF